MPVLSGLELAQLRRTYRVDIHNALVSCRLQLGPEEAIPSRPGYEGNTKQNHTALSDFPCSYYQFLSGKTTRVFRSRLEEQVFASGLWDDTEWMVQFVTDLPEILLLTSAATNIAPHATDLDDATKDFVAIGVVAGSLIQNITDGSEATVVTVTATQIVTTPLTGGTLNIYTLGDTYRILHPTSCKVGDQFYIHGEWRTVLGVIPDSEGVQSTALCSS